jgi:hypothetical protein
LERVKQRAEAEKWPSGWTLEAKYKQGDGFVYDVLYKGEGHPLHTLLPPGAAGWTRDQIVDWIMVHYDCKQRTAAKRLREAGGLKKLRDVLFVQIEESEAPLGYGDTAAIIGQISGPNQAGNGRRKETFSDISDPVESGPGEPQEVEGTARCLSILPPKKEKPIRCVGAAHIWLASRQWPRLTIDGFEIEGDEAWRDHLNQCGQDRGFAVEFFASLNNAITVEMLDRECSQSGQ